MSADTETTPTQVEKSLVEQFQALERELDGAEPEKPEAAPKPVAKAAPEQDEAEKGDDEDKADGRPTVAERVKFRAERREWKAKIAEEREAIARERAELERARSESGKVNETALRQYAETGRFDEIAQAAGFKDWNEAVGHAARAWASPEYKRTKELEARQRDLEKALKDREEQERAAVAERQATERRANGVKFLAQELGGWQSPEVQVLSEDEDFVAYVYDQVAHRLRSVAAPSDDEVREEIQDVIEETIPRIKARAERFRRAFGDHPAATEDEATEATPNRAGSRQPARQQKHVSKSRTVEAAKAPQELSEDEWFRLAKAEMTKALREDPAIHR